MTNRRGILAWVVSITMMFCAAGFAAAPLADHIPADACVYFGWRGVDAAGATYDKSHLHGVAEAWDLPQIINDVILPMVKQQGEPDSVAALQHMTKLMPMLYHHPWAFYVGQAREKKGGHDIVVDAGWLCDAGADADAMMQQMHAIQQIAPVGKDDPQLLRVGNIIGIVSDVSPEKLARMGLADEKHAQVKPVAALSGVDRFKSAIDPLDDQPMAALYVDVPSIVKQVDYAIKTQGDKEEKSDWPEIRAVFALDGIGRLAWTGGFDGADWREQMWLEAPAPRKGLLTLLDAAPLEAKVLKTVPRTASWFTTSRFDLAKLLPIVRNAMDHIDGGKHRAEFEQGLAKVNKTIGFDLQNDLLAALGDQWLTYGDFSAGGAFGINIMIANFTRDSGKLAASMAKAEKAVNDLLTKQADPDQPPEEGNFLSHIRIQHGKVGDTPMSYLNFPMISPAWAITKDRMYFSLSPSAIGTRVAFDSMTVSPITDSDTYTALRKRIGQPDASSVMYADLAQTAPAMLQQVTSMLQMMMMSPELQGSNIDVMKLMPKMDKLVPNLAPVMSVTWTDDTGYHSRAIKPFPGAELLSPAGMSSVSTTALGVGILLPSLSRARTIANRTVSATNLSMTYKALYVWSITHHDKFPTDLATLVKDGSLDAKMLLRPGSDTELPKNLPADQLARWAADHSDYVYRAGKVDANSPADAVVMYEKITPGTAEGINILFGDGHVEWVEMAKAIPLLKKAGENVEAPPADEGGIHLGHRTAAPPKAYFYDTVTKEYFVGDATKIPPIQSPKGHEAVRAHFFTCGTCSDAERFLGYYEKYTPEVKKKLDADPKDSPFDQEAYKGRMYSTDGEHWVQAESPEGFKIIEALQDKCPAKKLRYCPPK